MSEFKNIKSKARELGLYKIKISHNWSKTEGQEQEDGKIVQHHEYSICREVFAKFPKDQNIIGYISKKHFQITTRRIEVTPQASQNEPEHTYDQEKESSSSFSDNQSQKSEEQKCQPSIVVNNLNVTDCDNQEDRQKEDIKSPKKSQNDEVFCTALDTLNFNTLNIQTLPMP